MGAPNAWFGSSPGGIGAPAGSGDPSQLAQIMAGGNYVNNTTSGGNATSGQTVQYDDGSQWTVPQGWNYANGMTYDQYGQADPYRTQLPMPAAYQQLMQQQQAPAPVAPAAAPTPLAQHMAMSYLSQDPNSVNYMQPNGMTMQPGPG